MPAQHSEELTGGNGTGAAQLKIVRGTEHAAVDIAPGVPHWISPKAQTVILPQARAEFLVSNLKYATQQIEPNSLPAPEKLNNILGHVSRRLTFYRSHLNVAGNEASTKPLSPEKRIALRLTRSAIELVDMAVVKLVERYLTAHAKAEEQASLAAAQRTLKDVAKGPLVSFQDYKSAKDKSATENSTNMGQLVQLEPRWRELIEKRGRIDLGSSDGPALQWPWLNEIGSSVTNPGVSFSALAPKTKHVLREYKAKLAKYEATPAAKSLPQAPSVAKKDPLDGHPADALAVPFALASGF